MARTIEYSQNTVELLAVANSAFEAVKVAKADGKPYGEKGGLLDKCKDAVKDLNKSIIADCIDDFVTLARTNQAEFISQYMADWTVTGYAVADSEKDGLTFTNDKDLRVPFHKIDEASTRVKLTTRGDWAKLIQIFAYHCTLAWATDGGVSMEALPVALVNARSGMGDKWVKDGKAQTSVNCLVEQLQDIADAIFPAEICPRMNKKDVRNFGSAIRSYKRTVTNNGMKFAISTGGTAEDILFDAFHLRMNKLSVVVEDDIARGGKKSEPATMGEKSAKGETPVEVETPKAEPASK